MLRLFISLVLSVISLPAFAQHLELKEPKDFVRLVGEIDSDTVSQFVSDLTVAAETNKTVTVYIDSPGGNIGAGIRILDAVAGLKTSKPDLRLRCFAEFAASMAFAFMQVACDHRIVSEYSVLMMHQASVGMQGKWGEIQTRSELLKQVIDLLEQKVATRLKLSLPEYRSRVVNDWWIVGRTNLKEKSADFIGTVSCSAELVKANQCPLYTPSSADGRSRGQSAPSEGQTSSPQPKK